MTPDQLRIGQIVLCHGAFDNLGAPDGRGRVVRIGIPGLGSDSALVELYEVDGLDEHPPLDDEGHVLCMAYTSQHLQLLEQAPEGQGGPPLPQSVVDRIEGRDPLATPNLAVPHIAPSQPCRQRFLGRDEVHNARHEAIDLLSYAANEITEVMDHTGRVTRYINGEPVWRLMRRLEGMEDSVGGAVSHLTKAKPTGPAIGRGRRKLKI